jgi:hypothetical protein
VSDVTGVSGVREMSGAPRVDAARVDRATMHPAAVSDMRAAAVSGKTAKMRGPAAEMHATATKVRCTTAAKVGPTTATEMRGATTAKVRRATATEMRGATTAKVGAATTATEMRGATTAKMSAATTATTATTEMWRGNRERKGGNAEAQSGRQSNNNPTRHSTTPTI